MLTQTITEPPRLTGLLKLEEDQSYCREEVTVLAGSGAARVLTIGTVVGTVTTGVLAASAAKRTGTGTGTISTVGAPSGTVVGTHTAVCVAVIANSGRFVVFGPSGNVEGTAIVATPFVVPGAPTFTIDDGATDWALGDVIDIVVSQSAAGKIVALNLAGTDGSQSAYGVMLTNTTAPDGVDAGGVALVRGPAIVSDLALTYPSGATAGQKITINDALVALGIIIRTGV